MLALAAASTLGFDSLINWTLDCWTGCQRSCRRSCQTCCRRSCRTRCRTSCRTCCRALACIQFVSRNKCETTRAVMPRDDVDLRRVRHLPPTDSLSKMTKKISLELRIPHSVFFGSTKVPKFWVNLRTLGERKLFLLHTKKLAFQPASGSRCVLLSEMPLSSSMVIIMVPWHCPHEHTCAHSASCCY